MHSWRQLAGFSAASPTTSLPTGLSLGCCHLRAFKLPPRTLHHSLCCGHTPPVGGAVQGEQEIHPRFPPLNMHQSAMGACGALRDQYTNSRF